MNIDKINRGSEWRKWDLHIHIPLSIERPKKRKATKLIESLF